MKLCYPLNYVRINTFFSENHQGIDLGWYENPNMPVLTCFNGVVSRIYTDEAYGGGLTLSIKYDNGYSSDFKHLSKILVKVGDRVNQMQEVAIMGNSGWATTGPHLHFNLYENGRRVNPIEHCYLYPDQIVADKDKNIVRYYEERGDDMKFSVGDKVVVSGNLYSSSNATNPSGRVENKVTQITRVVQGALHPYNTTGDLGWMNENDIKLYEEPTTDYKELYERELERNNNLQAQLDAANQKIAQAISVLQ